MHTSLPLGAPLPATTNAATFKQVVQERRPAVSNLFDGVRHRQIVAVYVPVVRDGHLRFVLSAGLPAASFGEVLRAQQFSTGSVAVIQDREHVIVARTKAQAEMVGRRVQNPSPGQEGWVQSRLLEGTDVYVAFATAPLSGWRIVLTAPVAAVDGPWRGLVWQMLAGAAAAAAIAGLLAFIFGRRIAKAVGALVGIARAVERGEGALPLSTGVTEVDAVAEQLSAAAALARAREQDAAAGERQARAIGEVAHALNASPDLDTILRTAVEAVRGLVQADSSRIAIVDDAGRLVLRHSTQVATAMNAGFAIERGKGIGGLAWDAGEPIRTDDIRADPRFRGDRYLPIAEADGIVSCMAVPIVTSGTVVGVIYANNFARRPFTAGDEALLVTLAHHAAVAVQKARLLAREHAARAEAEAASRGKDELLAMLGHELRNPLSAIANAVAVLGIPSAPPETARRAREIIARQNAHLAHLVDDLLDVARVTSGKIALERRPVELAQAVRHSIATLAASGRTEHHRLSVALDPVWANVDETRFEQIVGNLVGNALRFTPAGGDIEVALRAADGLAVLRVRDSGIGIAPEMLARVFDLFVQGERSADRGSGGLGLGLTLVRRIAELHGGSVEAGSDGPGRGSEFTVRLPAMAPPPGLPGRSRADGDGAPRRILVVEDNADAREMLRIVLELAGHEVHEAVDGPTGLAAALDLRPDIALVDIGLPGFDGLEIARRVRHALGASIHLVALTGYGQPDDRRLALEAGFDAHLVKPVDPPALLAAICAVFSAAREA
jgi:signal transduction histidine kinase/ActR/RegA family two-component response regulator